MTIMPPEIRQVATSGAADIPHSLRLPPGYRVEDTAVGGLAWFAPDGFCRLGQRDRVAATDAAWSHHEEASRKGSASPTPDPGWTHIADENARNDAEWDRLVRGDGW